MNVRTLLFALVAVFATTARVRAEERPLKLAVVAPVTGAWGSYGREIVQGAQIAVEDLQASMGPIELIIEDACLAVDTVKAVSKLVSVDRIDAVIGSYCVVGMVPMAGILNRNKVIGFHTSAVSDEILSAGDFIFTTNITIEDEARALARYAFNDLGARRAAVLFLMTQWGQNYAQYFTDEFKALGGTVTISLENQIGLMDFRTELVKIGATKPDVTFISHVGTELGTAIKQARSVGINAPILGPHESEEQGVLAVAGSSAEGLTFLSPRLPTSGEAVAAFRKRYLNRFKVEPGILASNVYDAAFIVAQKLRQCGGDTVCAKNAIYKVTDYSGVSGVFSITPQGGTIKQFDRKKVKGGVFRYDQ